jgi:hypothetical protein
MVYPVISFYNSVIFQQVKYINNNMISLYYSYTRR